MYTVWPIFLVQMQANSTDPSFLNEKATDPGRKSLPLWTLPQKRLGGRKGILFVTPISAWRMANASGQTVLLRCFHQ